MAEVLSQSEIEALLAAMTTGEEGADAEAPAGGGTAGPSAAPGVGVKSRTSEAGVVLPLHKRRRAAAGLAMGAAGAGTGVVTYEPYDFRRPDKLSKEHLRGLQMLHETFSNHFASSLAGHLRAPVQIEVVSVEQVPYEEYSKSISVSLLNILNVVPLTGQAILEIDFGILFSMIDRLLGGTGDAGKVVRDLTDIEKMLAQNIVELALGELKTSWANISPLEFELDSMESSSQYVQIVPANDTVVLILLELHMGEYHGPLSLCIPYLLIKPILSKLSAQRWLATTSKKPSPLFAAGLAERLRTTDVPCVARLGVTELSVAEIAGLQIGQVLPMRVCGDADNGEPGRIGSVDVLIGSDVKFRGKTGLRGKRLAVQIEQVVAPAVELIAHKENH